MKKIISLSAVLAALLFLFSFQIYANEPGQTVPVNYLEDADLMAHAEAICREYSVCYEMVLAIINPGTGALISGEGPMHLRAEEHQERMLRLNLTDLGDPYQNITAGVDYLYECFREYHDTYYALTVYQLGTDAGASHWESGADCLFAADICKRSMELERQAGK